MTRRLLSVLALTLALVSVGVMPALAAEVDEVADVVADQGFFVEPGSSADPDEISRIVSDVRNEGENLSVVVLSEEPGGGATTFADAVVNRLLADVGTSGLVLVISPETVGFAGDTEVFAESEVDAALDAAIDAGGSDGDIAQSFASALVGVPVGAGATPTTGAPATTAPGSSGGGDSGGGGGGLLLLLLLVGGGLLLFFWLRSRRREQAQPAPDAAQLTKARDAVQEQLNAVANDILDMEDEVRLADNPRADRFYQDGSETYRAASEAFPQAQTPQQLLDLANQLDVAIWQLDSAEAVLDGNPLPERPEPRRLEMPRREPVGAPTGAPAGVPQPEYQRRSTRRSSYGGPSMMDLLIMVGGAVMSGRRGGGGLLGGSRSRGGGLFGRTSRSAPPPRSRETGSSPIPSPSRRGTSTRSSSQPGPGSRRGTGGRRIRGGRRRRR